MGPALAEKLAKIGIVKVIDLLFHLPLRYEDRTRVSPIGSAQVGQRLVVEGAVELTDIVFRGRRALVCHISDGTGVMALRFFHFSNAQKNNLKRGVSVRCFGEVRFGSKQREMIHPEYRVLRGQADEQLELALTPIYPVTDGIQQGRMRMLVQKAVKLTHKERLPDWVPSALLEELNLPTIEQAVVTVHTPPDVTDLCVLNEGGHPAQRRLAFDELLAHHMSLKLLRQRTKSEPGIDLHSDGKLRQRFLASLPFILTSAQQRVVQEITEDIDTSRPMLRLLQGDVGSGKTVVAAAVATRAVENGAQTAVMAPTELLVEQHLQSFRNWMAPLDVNVVSLTSKMPAKARRDVLAAIADGTAQVVIGTHALFQDMVEFHHLALVIVDEQHRFGVHQRLLLKGKSRNELQPHQLVMTATPIPRTLAQSAYADLDLSVIDALPPGRKPVTTVVMADSRRDEIIQRIATACADGQQAYWVCPLINESELIECQAAEKTAELLAAALPRLNIGLIHGQLKAQAKSEAMAQFAAAKTDLLVATTVIEVGVDVPNASLMIIENAERMGLAQLHQLRGRIGRGQKSSVCVLLYKPPLKGNARKRLEVIRGSTDGFEIAEEDLRLRGPGEVLGTRQTGRLQMRIADVVRDADLLPLVHQASNLIFTHHQSNIDPLIDRWIDEQGRYGSV